MNEQVLLVEDDRALAAATSKALSLEGFQVQHVETVAAALLQLSNAHIVLLDLSLPDATGFEACKTLRAAAPGLPIVVITARVEELDKILALELGADDYLPKPYSVRELTARIRAVLRRAQRVVAGAATIQLGTLHIDTRTRQVHVQERLVALTVKEYEILLALLNEPDRVKTRGELMTTVWGEHWWGSTKTLDVHISTLRKKLGDTIHIEALRGVGFTLSFEPEH